MNNSLTKQELENILNKILEISIVCSDIIETNFLQLTRHDISIKDEIDVVTKIDILIQEKIIEFLSSFFKEAKFISEEIYDNNHCLIGDGYTFIIDPIDGTSNFVYGLSFCCVSIGFAYNGEIIGGVVNAPIIKEKFYGMQGVGSFYQYDHEDVIDIKYKKINHEIELRKQIIGTSFPCINDIYNKLSKHISVRILGSIAITACYVLIGKLDGFYACVTKLWDIAGVVGILNASDCAVFHYYKQNHFMENGLLIIHKNKEEFELLKKIDSEKNIQ